MKGQRFKDKRLLVKIRVREKKVKSSLPKNNLRGGMRNNNGGQF